MSELDPRLGREGMEKEEKAAHGADEAGAGLVQGSSCTARKKSAGTNRQARSYREASIIIIERKKTKKRWLTAG